MLVELPRSMEKKERDWSERVTCRLCGYSLLAIEQFFSVWIFLCFIHHIVEDASGIFSPFPFRPQNPKFLWQLVVENAGDKTVYIFTVPDLDGMVCYCRRVI